MKWFFRLLLTLFCLILVLLGGVYAVWMKPGLVLTDARVNELFDHFAGDLFSKRPEGLKLNFETTGLWTKHVHVEGASFCLNYPVSCFKSVKVDFAFRLRHFTQVRIEEIGPVEILNESLLFKVTLPKQDETKPSSFDLSKHLEIPANVHVKDIDLDFKNVKIENGKELIKGSLTAKGKESSQITLDATANSNAGLEGKLSVVTALVPGQQNPFSGKVHFKSKGSIDGQLNGNMNWENQIGVIEGALEVKAFASWMNTIFVKNLKLDSQKDKLSLNADFYTRFEQRINFEKSKSVLPKAAFALDLHGKLEGERKDDLTHYQISLGPAHDQGITLDSKVTGVFPVPKGKELTYGLERVYFTLQIPEFQQFVESFKRTNFTVPAPFSALKGNVKFTIGTKGAEIADYTIPVELVTNLDSKEQTVKTESKANIVLAPAPQKIKITGESRIHNLKFTMPDIKVLEPAPLVKNDSRLTKLSSSAAKEKKKVETEGEEPSRIDLNWKISTDPSGIQIFHPILVPYAPAEVTWTLGDHPGGSIDLKPFQIEYLNRGALVKTLRFYQNPDDPLFHYTGELVIKKTDYTIYVDIIQDGDKPKIILKSDPILADSDIISVLLFNQTSADLDSDQGSSVASTQAAVTNRALGLFSILALSSTPVEAVNFNPTTGIYSARVKLANGLTATVGTDWDKTQQVALRKRLGKNFVLSTILQSDPQTSSETKKTLIEWFKRF